MHQKKTKFSRDISLDSNRTIKIRKRLCQIYVLLVVLFPSLDGEKVYENEKKNPSATEQIILLVFCNYVSQILTSTCNRCFFSKKNPCNSLQDHVKIVFLTNNYEITFHQHYNSPKWLIFKRFLFIL